MHAGRLAAVMAVVSPACLAVNIQNTCYINSVLQCVVAVPGFFEALVEVRCLPCTCLPQSLTFGSYSSR